MVELHGVYAAHAHARGQQPAHHLGKLYESGTRVLLPLTLLAHHALVDGLHIARFFEAFESGAQADY